MDNLLDVISSLPICLQYTIAVAVALATVGFPLSVIFGWITRWPMFKLWPPRKGWVADCPRDNKGEHLDPNIGWNKNLGARWSQMRRMLVNDFYRLNIRKPRVLSRIKIVTDGLRYPKKCRLEIQEQHNSEWLEIGEYEELDVAFSEPRKIIAFRFSIIEPRGEVYEDHGGFPAWSIYDIELTEVRLCGKWWRKIIREKI